MIQVNLSSQNTRVVLKAPADGHPRGAGEILTAAAGAGAQQPPVAAGGHAGSRSAPPFKGPFFDSFAVVAVPASEPAAPTVEFYHSFGGEDGEGGEAPGGLANLCAARVRGPLDRSAAQQAALAYSAETSTAEELTCRLGPTHGGAVARVIAEAPLPQLGRPFVTVLTFGGGGIRQVP